MSGSAHWNAAYEGRDDTALTWYSARPFSVDWALSVTVPGDPIVDIGAGASTFVDHMAAAGRRPVTVLDLSHAALDVTRARLGERADEVRFLSGDVMRWHPDRPYVLWHDRAVFHFLSEAHDQQAYVETMALAIPQGGHAIFSTFALNGPEKCSGLPVVRYSPATLAQAIDRILAGQFTLIQGAPHDHITPRGGNQAFQTSLFKRL